MLWPLKNITPFLNSPGYKGDFAYKRSFYYHPGVDLYCEKDQEVIAVEDCEIVAIEIFTGPNSERPSPWWNETFAVLAEGDLGVLVYGELIPEVKVGDKLKAGDLIGKITPVLKEDKGNGTTMLHFEHYKKGTKVACEWLLDQEMPENLLNSRILLESILSK